MDTTTSDKNKRALLFFRTLMGPVWALAGLLFFTGCIIADLDGDGFGNNDVVARQAFSIEVDVTTQVRLRLDALNGNVEIIGRPDAATVTVSGEKQVGSNSRTDAERRLDDLDVRVDERTEEITITTLQPRNTQGRNYTVNYTITLPADLVVVPELINGNIVVSDIDNDVSVTNTNGNVRLRDIDGNASVLLTNGNIESAVVMPPGGAIELATTNGNIILEIPATTTADFSARVTNGAIALDNLTLTDPARTNRSLTGTLNDGDGTIELRTVNGTISARGF